MVMKRTARQHTKDGEDVATEIPEDVLGPRDASFALEGITAPRRLPPRPDEGLPFAEALDETMRDHRAVFAALAK